MEKKNKEKRDEVAISIFGLLKKEKTKQGQASLSQSLLKCVCGHQDRNQRFSALRALTHYTHKGLINRIKCNHSNP